MSRTPEDLRFDSDIQGTPFNGVFIENASCAYGPAQYALAQKLDGEIAHEPLGEAELGMSLRSWSVSSWETLEIGGPALGGSVAVRIPTLETCRPGCAAQVEHGLCFEANLAGGGQGNLRPTHVETRRSRRHSLPAGGLLDRRRASREQRDGCPE